MIDLHTHSLYSDGTDTPSAIVKAAAGIGLKAVALTDHDGIDGIDEFIQTGVEYPELETIGGVELSSLYYGRELHVLGLYVNTDNAQLNELIEAMRQSREERAKQILLKLKSLGFPLEMNELTNGEARLAAIGRPHFAVALLKKYPDQFKSREEIFAKLLRRGAAAFVMRKLPNFSEALLAAKAASGVAIWAHPIYRGVSEYAFARRIIKRFAGKGLDGIECYYSLYGPEETARLSGIAAEFGLVRAGGSDYHGENSPAIKLGYGCGKLAVPDEILLEIKARKNE